MRKIYIYGENREVITVMREGIKDLLCDSQYDAGNAEPAFGYAGVIRSAEELLEKVQKSLLPPVVLLNLQPGRNILLLQALREIREGVGIAVFSPEITYPDRVVARWFNCTLNQDTDVAEGDTGKYLIRAIKKGLLKYHRQTGCTRAESLIPELDRRITETVRMLDYILHISLLSESLTKKERTMLSYIREGRSVEQTAALTKAGRNAVGGWYRNLCERLTLQCDRTLLAENFMLLPEKQNNPFRTRANSILRRAATQQREGVPE
ncbi:TPA: hypothetical protein ACIU9R_004583 [Salmonella enterica subsp. enterica serovar Birkenhead]|uniref:hypothetical protein n=1 Tax=Salmonella enterica TaxID=28901 RepID=UPI0012AA04AC|nr:hypothetical protein [Salmonella enterica]EBY7195414.1 hypothetical protein [Salmonella enterica subsp. enterica serovar Birkenhead]EDV0048508.1 hypothetical protein [Salmonella enterica subsp. enterica serovar Birkenhead]EHI3951160.1 hypothetical protein [Salmonella enterica]EHI6135400.1 hypothetical protein [Salmonella enterica]EHI7993676.1 hypothetical protein [Salmonella enterica]